MSNICYSIFKLEPYTTCPFQCTYCYVNFLHYKRRINETVFKSYIKEFRRIILDFYRVFKMVPAFRLSTLTDPFQPIEKHFHRSYKLMKTCLNYRCPIIINTKGTLLVEEPWITVLKELAKRNLVIHQPTIPFLDPEAKIIEKNAPGIHQRLETARKLSKIGVPIIARIQPLILGINTDKEYLDELLNSLKKAGAKQIIVEFIRFTSKKEITTIYKGIKHTQEQINKILNKKKWETIPKSNQKRPTLQYRKHKLKEILELTKEKNLELATCREGLYEYHTAPNCCGLHHLKKYIVRPTILEILKNETNNEKIMNPEKINRLKTNVRSPLKQHIEYIKKTIKHQQILKKIAPSLITSQNISPSVKKDYLMH